MRRIHHEEQQNPYEINQKGTENVSELIPPDSCVLCDETLTPEQSQEKINKSLAVEYRTKGTQVRVFTSFTAIEGPRCSFFRDPNDVGK